MACRRARDLAAELFFVTELNARIYMEKPAFHRKASIQQNEL